jgi:tetratricopeptide (TPR) repeat protein
MEPSGRVKYNPGVLGDEELVRSFVVRQTHLDMILEAVLENSEVPSNRHLLVVGPRGIGKTMLVRRVAAEVRANPNYNGLWLPVVYGEESYQVSSSGEFWLEALMHLSATADAPVIERTLNELRDERDDARLRERALAQLLDYADACGKRLMLVVENLNMLCDDMPGDDAWKLRHTLLNERRIMLIGTATSRFDAVTDPSQAWFELFAIQELKPLDKKESRELWSSITREDLGSGHVRAIRILTGGNPRLLAILAGFATRHSFRELMDQLVHLIDDHTEYFKSHLDSLASKERKVFVTLLEYWNPVGAADIARTSRLNVNEVSSLLNRLASRGAVEVFERRPRRKLYQAAERLYNIYYLMRRRGHPADRVRAAVSFMVLFYGSKRLATTIVELAREGCALPTGATQDHFAAYEELARHAPREILERALSETPQEFFEREDAPDSLRTLARSSRFRVIMNRALAALKSKDLEQAVIALREAIELNGNQAAIWAVLGSVLMEQGRDSDAIPFLRKAVELDPGSWQFWWSLGRVLRRSSLPGEEAEKAYRKAIDLGADIPCIRHEYGIVLGQVGRLEEAERFCEQAIEMDPQHAAAWSDLGFVLKSRRLFSEAEEKYRRAITLAPESARMQVQFALFLIERERFEEATDFYRNAVRLNPGDASLWSGLGHLVSEHGSAIEAEEVWTEALDAHPGLAPCAIHLLDARIELGIERSALVHQAEEWIARADRSPDVLGSMARFVVRNKIFEALPRGRSWASEAVSKSPDWVFAETLAIICAAQGHWTEALESLRPVLDAAVASDETAQYNATQFLIQCAAAGSAKQALELLSGSKAVTVLEPLVVGLRFYLGESPQVAKEILEIGNDVAERIRETARGEHGIDLAVH